LLRIVNQLVVMRDPVAPSVRSGRLSITARRPGLRSPKDPRSRRPFGNPPEARTDVHQQLALARGVSAHHNGAAAAAVLGLAVPAGASTGTAEISPEQAGYTATGAQFKTIAANVFLRQPGQFADEVARFGHSVRLWSSGLVVTLGVTASTSGIFPAYTTYATIYNRSTHQVIASNPNAQTCDIHFCNPGPTTLDPGFTLGLSIRYFPASGALDMVANYNDPDYTSFESTYTVTGQSFTQARVGSDLGSTPWDGSHSYTPPAQYTKIAAFSYVNLETYSEHSSTLWSWWVHHKLLANTGQQSGSDWVAVPTDLTDGGANFQTWFVPQSGQRPSQLVLH
jgi:hypothetical protein